LPHNTKEPDGVIVPVLHPNLLKLNTVKNIYPHTLVRTAALGLSLLVGSIGNSALAQTPYYETMRVSLFNLTNYNDPYLVDGNLTNYCDIFTNEVGPDDAIKLNNPGENISIFRSNQKLAVEQRKIFTYGDTTVLSMWNMSRTKYRLVIKTERINNHPNVRGFLEDGYERISYPLDLNGTTNYDFLVNSDPNSSMSNRFRVVFYQVRRVKTPIQINDVLIRRNGNANFVQWSTANEEDMNAYDVEYSTDDVNYHALQTVTPYNTPDKLSYSVRHVTPAGMYHYRIKAKGNDGTITYSKTSSILISNESAEISVYPNPVANKQLNLQFNKQLVGKYQLMLITPGGSKLNMGTVQIATDTEVQRVQLPATVTPGIYRLQIVGPDGAIQIKTIKIV
jgi:hypothetical protein